MSAWIIIGCGYLGQRVAHRLQQQGETPIGMVRSLESLSRLEANGVTGAILDLDQAAAAPPDDTPALADARLFLFYPPPDQGVTDERSRRLIRLFERLGQPRRIVYLSTTGVYGDCAGDWVDEETPVNPQVDRARRRWDAEQQWRAWREQQGGELVVLRVAGIYGPGKLPLERLRKGLPMVSEEQAPYTNRIHIDDLVQVCIAAMARGGDGEVYNVTDGRPGNMTDYFNRVADRAGLPRPQQIGLEEAEGQLSAGILSYMRESRRLRNDKMLRDLGIELIHPDLDSGLEACF